MKLFDVIITELKKVLVGGMLNEVSFRATMRGRLS
jgi:hypothetical protein